MARQTRGTPRSRNARRTQQKRTRSWPQFIVVIGVVALLAVGFVLMLRPQDRVQQQIYPVSYRDAILSSSERHNVSPYLVCATIKTESNWREDVESAAGAVGLMQVMPSTAESLVNLGYVDAASYPPENLADPVVNIEYGCAALEFLSRQLETTEEVIAAYNAGLGTVQAWLAQAGSTNFVECITYPETARYLARVTENLGHYEELYDTGLRER